jgi:hypothetical protein
MIPSTASTAHLVSLLFLLLLRLWSSAAAAVFGSETMAISIPSFTMEELTLGARSQDLLQALRTTGLLSVQVEETTQGDDHKDGQPIHRSVAMNGLCHCLESVAAVATSSSDRGGVEGVDSVVLDDQATRRTTIATATVGTSPLPLASRGVLEENCGLGTVAAMEVVRDQVAMASDTFVESLDRLHMKDDYNNDVPLLRDNQGRSYSTLKSVVQSANHLEHFHHYSKESHGEGVEEYSQDDSAPSLEWHTDAGLFLAFVPAWDCHSSGGKLDTSFWVKLPDGKQVQVNFDPGTVVIMMGAGAEHWLLNSLGLRATRHAVRMSNGDARTWYGMSKYRRLAVTAQWDWVLSPTSNSHGSYHQNSFQIIVHLVPDNAIIQEFPTRQTFSEMKTNMRLLAERQQVYGDINTLDYRGVAVGCGPAIEDDSIAAAAIGLETKLEDLSGTPIRRRLQHVQDASACNNATNFFCWMQCLEIPNYQQAESYVIEGYSLYCLDPGTLARTGNQVSKAIVPCEGEVHNSNCMGVWHPASPVIPGQEVSYNVTVSSDSDIYCYGGTSMYMDGFHWIHDTTCVIYLFPQWVLSTQGKFAAACIGTLLFGVLVEYVISRRRDFVTKLSGGHYRLFASAGFYGLQLIMGYLIMLVVMTYSIPLFLCCVMGLVGGHVLFNAKDALLSNNNSSNKTLNAGSKSDTQDAEATNMTDEERARKTPKDSTTTIPECYCNNTEPAQQNGTKEVEEDHGIPEGSTPCCQNVL